MQATSFSFNPVFWFLRSNMVNIVLAFLIAYHKRERACLFPLQLVFSDKYLKLSNPRNHRPLSLGYLRISRCETVLVPVDDTINRTWTNVCAQWHSEWLYPLQTHSNTLRYTNPALVNSCFKRPLRNHFRHNSAKQCHAWFSDISGNSWKMRRVCTWILLVISVAVPLRP